jgi:hypothetical protein
MGTCLPRATTVMAAARTQRFTLKDSEAQCHLIHLRVVAKEQQKEDSYQNRCDRVYSSLQPPALEHSSLRIEDRVTCQLDTMPLERLWQVAESLETEDQFPWQILPTIDLKVLFISHKDQRIVLETVRC